VVNLAFRGAAAADGGALVAEVLHQEYPRQIYVTNVGVMQAADPAGSDPYRFAFWEAYYKGLLMNYAPRNQALRVHYQGSPGDRQTRVEIIGRVWLDRVLHFRDLWNWIGMRWVFTVPIVYYPTWTERLQPRQNYTDQEGNFDDTPFSQRFSDRGLDIELRIVRGSTEGYYQPAVDGGWVLNAVLRQRFVDLNRAIMPEPLRRRTLIVVSKNSPYYVDKLTAPEQARDDQAYRDSVEIWRDSGYHAITYASDITAEDYGDRAHLTVSGGRKLAALVAENVRAIAAEQGYLSSSVPKP
jgi:hypothetical protein